MERVAPVAHKGGAATKGATEEGVLSSSALNRCARGATKREGHTIGRLTEIADAVAVAVELVGVRHTHTGVAGITIAIKIAVELVVAVLWADVAGVTIAVEVAVELIFVVGEGAIVAGVAVAVGVGVGLTWVSYLWAVILCVGHAVTVGVGLFNHSTLTAVGGHTLPYALATNEVIGAVLCGLAGDATSTKNTEVSARAALPVGLTRRADALGVDGHTDVTKRGSGLAGPALLRARVIVIVTALGTHAISVNIRGETNG